MTTTVASTVNRFPSGHAGSTLSDKVTDTGSAAPVAAMLVVTSMESTHVNQVSEEHATVASGGMAHLAATLFPATSMATMLSGPRRTSDKDTCIVSSACATDAPQVGTCSVDSVEQPVALHRLVSDTTCVCLRAANQQV